MLEHSTTISPASPYGGDTTARSRIRLLEKLLAAPTLTAAARAALGGGLSRAIAVSWETLIELESNRTGYDVAAAVWWANYIGASTNLALNPSAEVNVTGYTANDATLSRVIGGSGGNQFQLAPASAGFDNFLELNNFGVAGGLAALFGKTISIGGMYSQPAVLTGPLDARGRRLAVYVQAPSLAGGVMQYYEGPQAANAVQLDTASSLLGVFVPADTTYLSIRWYGGASNVAANLMRWDYLQIAEGATLPNYSEQAPALTAVDGSVDDLAMTYDARRNPTVKLALADVTLADTGAIAADEPTLGESHPYGVAPAGTRYTIRNPYSVSGGPTWSRYGDGANLATVADAASPTGRAFVLPTPLTFTGAYESDTTTESPYRLRTPSGGGRRFTVGGYLAPSGGKILARWRFCSSDNGGGDRVDWVTPIFTVEDTAGAYVRTLLTVDTAGAPYLGAYNAARDQLVNTWGGYARCWLELAIEAGTTATSLRFAAPQLYAGDDRGSTNGLEAAWPMRGGVTFEQRFRKPDGSNRTRRISRVDVHGEARFGQVTSVRVDGLLANGTPTYLGTAASSGRLSVAFPAADVIGVRVTVEETSSGDLGAVWISELDPAYVLDVSSRVISAGIASSRELDPGSASLPLGNVEAATLDLDLENTDRQLSPSSNAMIGTSHRIEAAVGVRYSNLVDPDLRSWTLFNGIKVGDVAPGDGFVEGGVRLTTQFAQVRSAAFVTPPGTVTARIAVKARRIVATAEPYLALIYPVGTNSSLGPNVFSTPAGVGQMVAFGVDVPVAAGLLVQLAALGTYDAGGGTAEMGDASVVCLDVAGNPITVEERVPAGVYWSTGWDSSSDSSVVSIAGVDRLGRYGSTDVDEPVTTNVDAATAVATYALRYLDLDEDELDVTLSSGFTFPYLFPTGSVGTCLADIAKATNAVLGLDRLDRLALVERATVPASSSVTVRDDDAVIRARTPIVEEQIANVIDAEATPLEGVPGTVVYEMGETEAISLAVGETLELWAPYSSSPATGVTSTAFVQTGTASGVLTTFADTARLVLTGGAAGGTFSGWQLTGTVLAARPLKIRAEHAASIRRYGRRPRTVTAALVQTIAQLKAVAVALRDAFSGIDPTSGERQLPDVDVDVLGMPQLELGDRVTVLERSSGISGEYQAISHRLAFDAGGLRSSLRGRRVDAALLARADVSLADNAELASY